MCGIHFIVSNDTYLVRGDEYFKDAFVANQLRGMHSSGMYLVEKDGTILTHKAAVCGQEFLKDKEAIGLFNKVNRARIAVGHVRHATAGKISDDNAHPFVIEREDGSQLVGVHNGTLRNWKLKEGSKDIDVDSEWAFLKLAEYGNDAFRFFDGAFAFVWYDTATPDVIYMARNSERPLHYMVSKDRKSILGASELGMVGWLTERNKIEGAADVKDRFKYLEPGKIYTISLKDPTNVTAEDAPKYDSTTSRFPPVTYTPVHRGNTHYTSTHSSSYPRVVDGEDDVPFSQAVPLYYDRNNEAATTAILKQVSDALRAVRNAREEESSEEESVLLDEVQQDSLELAAITDEVFRQQVGLQQPNSAVDTTLFITNPVDTSATKHEIEAAKNSHLYGAVVEFTGVMFDEELAACVGNARVFSHGRWTDHDAELRNVARSYAHHKFIDPIRPTQLAVVGWNPNIGGGTPPYYILAELTEGQKRMIDMRTKRMTAH